MHESIRRHTAEVYELIVVDNDSTDGTADYLRQQFDIIAIFNKEDLIIPKGCNQGTDVASGEYLLFLNNDTVVTRGWLGRMLRVIVEREKVGLVGPVSNYASGYFQRIPVDYREPTRSWMPSLKSTRGSMTDWCGRCTISLCMIVKDEEAVISHCLDSVKDLLDEIVIVDTGSSDNTKAIVKRYTDRIFDFAWVDDFSAARNFSFDQARMDYILWLDADDVLDEENREKYV